MKNLLYKFLRWFLQYLDVVVIKRTQYHSLDKYLDYNEFNYINMIYELYNKIHETPGHIIELGVARGRNTIFFGNYIKSWNDLSRKYYGFDTFSGYSEEDLKLNPNLRNDTWKNDEKIVHNRIRKSGLNDICIITKGDIKETIPMFIRKNPDIKIALVYVDCNAYLPTIQALEVLKSNFLEGTIICIDEKRDGGETRALKEFANKYGCKLIKDKSPFSLPAYIKIGEHND